MAHVSDLIEKDIQAYLYQHEHKSLLRFITCGSVDDGKSTLIGRLLYDSKMIFEDQLAALEADSKKVGTQGGELDFALLVDGLAAEREQASRSTSPTASSRPTSASSSSPTRRGTSSTRAHGHRRVDGRAGRDPDRRAQGRADADAPPQLPGIAARHPQGRARDHKMDLVEYSREIFETIVAEYRDFARQIDLHDIVAIPVSGLKGDNITAPSEHTSWYHGPTLMGYLETVEIEDRLQHQPFGCRCSGSTVRTSISAASPHDRERHGESGREAAGAAVRAREPGGAHRHDGRRPRARRGWAVGDDHARGRDRREPRDVLACTSSPPAVADQFETTIVWMADEPMLPGRPYWMKIGTKQVAATITEPKYKVNVNTLEHLAAKKLALNEIGVCNVSLDHAVAFDPYVENRDTGASS